MDGRKLVGSNGNNHMPNAPTSFLLCLFWVNKQTSLNFIQTAKILKTTHQQRNIYTFQYWIQIQKTYIYYYQERLEKACIIQVCPYCPSTTFVLHQELLICMHIPLLFILEKNNNNKKKVQRQMELSSTAIRAFSSLI